MTAPLRVAVVLDRTAEHLPAVPGRRVLHTVEDETVDDALHRQLAGAALRGALVGAAVLAVLTVVVAIASGIDAPPSLGLGVAVGLTGGPFFGSLAGFGLGLRRVERLRRDLGADLERRGAVLVLPARRGRRAVRP